MKIDPGSPTPVFRQIVEGMQSAIAAGVYQPGEPVPSTRTLAVDLKVNPNTVQRAYEQLVMLGVLQSRRGLGKVVANKGNQSAMRESQKAVADRFLEGIEIARTAGLGDQQIRNLLNKTLKSPRRKERAS